MEQDKDQNKEIEENEDKKDEIKYTEADGKRGHLVVGITFILVGLYLVYLGFTR